LDYPAEANDRYLISTVEETVSVLPHLGRNAHPGALGREAIRCGLSTTSSSHSRLSPLATPHPKKDDEQIPSSRFVYYPTADGQVKALRTWFAPSTPYGQDIVYPKTRASELAIASKENVIAIPEETKEAEYKTVPYTTITREGSETAYTAPEPETKIAQVAPRADTAPPVPALPRTASDVPLVTLIGLASVGAAIALRRRQA